MYYKPDKDISECINKSAGWSHFGCCGLNITTPQSHKADCRRVGNTKASRQVFQMEQEMVAKKLNGTADIKCSNQKDEIKGACEDFVGVMIDDQRKCLKLTESNNTKTCCGLNVKMDMGKQGIILPFNFCLALPIDKKQRDYFIKQIEIQTEGAMKVEDYLCENNYLYLINFNYFYLLLLLLF